MAEPVTTPWASRVGDGFPRVRGHSGAMRWEVMIGAYSGWLWGVSM